MNLNQIKFKVNESFENNEKTATNFQPIKDDDVVTKVYPDIKKNQSKWTYV